jgi:Flp pilus assembly protein TadD
MPGSRALARAPVTSTQRRRISPNVAAAAQKKKGFGGGGGTASGSDSDGGGKQRGGGGGGANAQIKRVRQPKPATGIAAREDMMVRRVEALEAAAQRQDEEDDFEARLAALRTAGKAKAAAIAAAPSASPAAAAAFDASLAPLPGPFDTIDSTGNRTGVGGGGSSSSSTGSAASGGGGLYDGPPPSLAKTLLGAAAAGGVGPGADSTISDPALRDAAIGPGRGLLAAGAVALAGIVFFMAGAETAGPSRRYQGLRASGGPPAGAEALALERQADELELKLGGGGGGGGLGGGGGGGAGSAPSLLAAGGAEDLETLEALAVTRARLFEFDKAEPLLARLTAARPADAEAWRLLGEVRLLARDEPGAVAAYLAAAKLRPDDLKVATGLADAYIANGQQGKAADYVIKLRKAGGGVPSPAEAAAAAQAEAAAAAAAAPQSGGGSSSSSSSSQSAAPPPYRRIDDVSARLLLGKAYAAWRGHDADALAAYDDLIEAYPEDFRGYLAKGVLLRQRGRQADSERLLLQARFYAPDELKAYVAQRAGGAAREVAPDAPPDNNSG